MTGLSLKEECELRKKKEEEEARLREEREREREKWNAQREKMDRRRRSSRSRSRDRSHRRSSSMDRRRSWSKERSRRSRSRERERRPRVYRTDDPQTINCRVFVGNFPTGSATEPETRELFEKHGRVLALSIHKNFAFIQFEKEEEARAAVAALTHTQWKGSTLDVKMAAEGQRKRRSRSRSPIRGPKFREEAGYREDVYRDRPPLRDPYLDRRDPYAPARPARPGDRPPFEVQMIIHSPQQRQYAELIDRRLRSMDMTTDILVVIEQELNKLLTDSTLRGVPYAIVLTAQNEIHRSLTLNILYGAPQVHRNMPLEDAMSLINRNFQIFLRERQERLAKATALPPPPPAVPVAPVAGAPPPEFVVPDKYTRYLLNLLADDRILTLDELDKIMDYLEERRYRYTQVKGGTPRIPSRFAAVSAPAVATVPSVAEKVIDQQQQQLQDRILSILNGGEAQLPSQMQLQQLQAQVQAAQLTQVQAQMPTQVQPKETAGGGLPINLDNPSIQKALDDLLSSGPLIANLGSTLQDIANNPPNPPTSVSYPQPVPPPSNYMHPSHYSGY